jgi:hypothetical protein
MFNYNKKLNRSRTINMYIRMSDSTSLASMSSLNTFASWVSKYNTWAELKAWLQAEEPGIDIIESEDSAYAILRNSKEKEGEAAIAEDAVSEAGQLCRSVVWDTEANLPCCVSPFAARRDQKIPSDTSVRLEDFVEGVMVNVFRARGDAETHVTTRSKLDADGTFYSERSFRELFEEAMDAKRTSLNEIEKLIGAPVIQWLQHSLLWFLHILSTVWFAQWRRLISGQSTVAPWQTTAR